MAVTLVQSKLVLTRQKAIDLGTSLPGTFLRFFLHLAGQSEQAACRFVYPSERDSLQMPHILPPLGRS